MPLFFVLLYDITFPITESLLFFSSHFSILSTFRSPNVDVILRRQVFSAWVHGYILINVKKLEGPNNWKASLKAFLEIVWRSIGRKNLFKLFFLLLVPSILPIVRNLFPCFLPRNRVLKNNGVLLRNWQKKPRCFWSFLDTRLCFLSNRPYFYPILPRNCPSSSCSLPFCHPVVSWHLFRLYILTP